MYDTKAQTSAAPASMLADSSRLCDNLSEVLNRVSKIADTLHGPEPRETAGIGNAPAPIQTVRRNIDQAFVVIDRIHNELSRIDNRL